MFGCKCEGNLYIQISHTGEKMDARNMNADSPKAEPATTKDWRYARHAVLKHVPTHDNNHNVSIILRKIKPRILCSLQVYKAPFIVHCNIIARENKHKHN